MKRFVCLVLTAVMLMVAVVPAGAADAMPTEIPMEEEILFRGIAWDSSILEVRTALAEQGLIGENRTILDQQTVETWNQWDDEQYAYVRGVSCRIGSGVVPSDILIAGYPIYLLEIYATHGYDETGITYAYEDSQLFTASYELEIVDQAAVESDLVGKLTDLYGEYEIIEEEQNVIVIGGTEGNYTEKTTYYVWYGANNTGVWLRSQWNVYQSSVEQGGIKLMYGRTNGIEVLNAVVDAKEKTDAASEQESMKENSNNYDGL